MTITASQFQTQGTVRRAQGSHLDDAATPGALVITLGFVPTYFQWLNETDRITEEKYEGMAVADVLHTAVDGVRTLNTGSLVVIAAPSGNQSGGSGTPDPTNAGVINNVAYPGPSTIVNDTKTQQVGVEAAATVTIATGANLQNKQYRWVAVA